MPLGTLRMITNDKMMRSQLKTENTAEIKTEEKDGALVVHLTGQIDEVTADALSGKLDDIIADGYTKIVFELGNVLYIGSSGLGQIMRAYRQVKGSEGFVRVVNPQPLICDLLHLTKLNKILTIHGSVEEALEAENAEEE